MAKNKSKDMLIALEDDPKPSNSSFQDKDKNQFIIKQKIRGLPNIGNTCFLNSILQQLFALETFRDAIITKANRSNMRIIRLLSKIF